MCGAHRHVLSSEKEAVAYVSLATAKEGIPFNAARLELADLALADGDYRATIVKPDSRVLRSVSVKVKDGRVAVSLPAFTDDLAVHVVGSGTNATSSAH